MQRLATCAAPVHSNSLFTAFKHVHQRTDNALYNSSAGLFCYLETSVIPPRRACSGSTKGFRCSAALEPERSRTISDCRFPSVATSEATCSSGKRSFVSAAMHDSAAHEDEALSRKDASLVQLFLAASLHLWEQLPGDSFVQLHAIAGQDNSG